MTSPFLRSFTFVLLLLRFASTSQRSFRIDYANDRFVKDGEPFRYISGSIHYFRVPSIYWQDRLDKMAAAGLNAIQTYVEWSQHEPEPEVYVFDGELDVTGFLRLVNDTGLLAIVRPGPYIDAERDFGGLPYWLLRERPEMELRSSDPGYLEYVDRWWTKLFRVLEPLLYVNGGPIIAIQLENEYGSYGCDRNYTAHLRDLARDLLRTDDVIFFTTDGDSDELIECGKIDGVYATIDFGPESDVERAFETQRKVEPHGPLVNSEFYTGWFDTWGVEPHFEPNSTAICDALDAILARNASVNMYMFHGGTSFGFTSGSYVGGAEEGQRLEPCPTSYDYSAPLSEAGDPTPLYHAVRDVILRYVDPPTTPVPPATPKAAYGTVHFRASGKLYDHILHSKMALFTELPITFEELGQASGFILCTTPISAYPDPVRLDVPGIRDRGYVYVDSNFAGVLSRMDDQTNLTITVPQPTFLSILVENQGRVCAGSQLKDFKGIVSNVTLAEGQLTGWAVTSVPLNDTKTITGSNQVTEHGETGSYFPTFYVGQLVLAQGQEPQDTFLNPTGWQKGVVFVNDFNVGRYWPSKGPQVTLFVPKNLLKAFPEANDIKVFELEAPSDELTMAFQDYPIVG